MIIAYYKNICFFFHRFWTGDRNNTVNNRQPTPFGKLKRQCLERGIIWEDPDFTPSYKLLPKSKKSSYPVVWLRPHVSYIGFYGLGIGNFDKV
jgi:hypothetical protein